MANIRFKVNHDFDCPINGFLYVINPEDNLHTIGHLKNLLATFLGLNVTFEFDIFLNDSLLPDCLQISVIRDNETIELRSRHIDVQIVDQIKAEPNDEPIFDLSDSSSPLPEPPVLMPYYCPTSLDQISPLIGLSAHNSSQSMVTSLKTRTQITNRDKNSTENSTQTTFDSIEESTSSGDQTVPEKVSSKSMLNRNPARIDSKTVTTQTEDIQIEDIQTVVKPSIRKSKRTAKKKKSYKGFFFY